MIGISPPTGTSGFGSVIVYGLRRVPFPPAKIIALIKRYLFKDCGSPPYNEQHSQELGTTGSFSPDPQPGKSSVTSQSSPEPSCCNQEAVPPRTPSTQPLLVADDPGLRVYLIDEDLRHFTDRMLDPCCQIDFFTNGSIRFHGRDKAFNGICHVIQIPGRGKASQSNLGMTGEELGDDRRNECSCRLPGTISVEWSEDGHR